MPFLIILRGPAGSGKSTLCNSIQNKLGAKTHILMLDQIIPQVFNNDLAEAQRHEYVIGEMFFGDSHTTDPIWIKFFKDNHFLILSVILRCSLKSCFQRVQNRPDHKIDLSQLTISYDLFYRELQNIFAFKAEVEEICIDTEYKSIDQSSDKILDHLKLL